MPTTPNTPNIDASVDRLELATASLRGAHTNPAFHATMWPPPTGSMCFEAEGSAVAGWGMPMCFEAEVSMIGGLSQICACFEAE